MSAPKFLRYPKSAASTVVDEFTHPNTAKFERNLSTQDSVINSVKLRSIATTLPGYETLCYGYDKIFSVEGMRLSYPIVLYIGYAKGSLWACPDGNVVRETKKPFDEQSTFWTAHTAVHIPFAPSSKVPNPFDKCPVLHKGLLTPMGAEAQALVRYYTTLRAQDSDLTKHSMEFPDIAVLLNVFRLLAPSLGHSDQDLPTDIIEGSLKSPAVSNLPLPASATVECTIEHVSSSEDPTPNHLDTPSCGTVTAASKECTDPPVHDVHGKNCKVYLTAEIYTDECTTKRHNDLTALLERKADIQAKIEERHKSAEREDSKAQAMLRQRNNRKNDLRECLDEAMRLRSLVRDDQKEVDAIDKHLASALYESQLTSPSASKRDHPPPE